MSLSDILALIYQVLRFPLFTVKSTTVTLSSIIMFFLVMAGFLLLSRIFLKIVLTKLLSRLKMDEGTRYNLLRITHYIVLVIGAIIAFQFVGIDLSGLIVIFGFLSSANINPLFNFWYQYKYIHIYSQIYYQIFILI